MGRIILSSDLSEIDQIVIISSIDAIAKNRKTPFPVYMIKRSAIRV
jgi:hypothetical protein